ncbi:MAG TPA: CPBP family glutamic-type intramembrane protease, partial [Clostridia bacterium]
MNKNKEIKNIGKLIFLHLFPGIALSIVYIFFSKIVLLEGYPKIVIASLSAVFSIIPIELGLLFYVAKKEDGSYNIFKILGLKSNMSITKLILYSLSLCVAGGTLMTVLKPASDYLLNIVFCWIPGWYNWNQDMSLFNRNIIVLTIVVEFILLTLIVPFVEELYFRGYLLSRMKWMGKYSVLL